jgi:AP-2 complex subunit beta-1
MFMLSSDSPETLTARSKAQELRIELQAADKRDKGYAKKKTVLKKIVANMTMGNDSA